jgi:hypothetical protein
VQLLGCPRQVPKFCHRDECPQLIQFHLTPMTGCKTADIIALHHALGL